MKSTKQNTKVSSWGFNHLFNHLSFLIKVSFFALFTINNTSAQEIIDPDYLYMTDGIASPNVTDVIQDTFGLIWIATGNGLQKYDGYKLETFKRVAGKKNSLLHNNTWGLMEDENHDIWVSHSLGVSRYDRKNNKFKNYAMADHFDIPSEGDVGTVFKLYRDKSQKIYATTLRLGLIEFDRQEDSWGFVKYNINGNDEVEQYDFSIALTEDGTGRLWCGSTAYGLLSRGPNDNDFKNVADSQLDSLVGMNSITALYLDETKVLWITTRRGIYKYNIQTKYLKNIITYDEGNTNGWNNWNWIMPDNDGNVWITNNYRGILKFKGISDQYQEINLRGKVKMLGVGWNITHTRFMIDKGGIFWIGSREFGLVKYDPINKPFHSMKHDPSNPNGLDANGVYGILNSNKFPNRVYIGSRGSGFYIYDSESGTLQNKTFKVEDDVFEGAVRSFYEEEDGGLWLGTWGDGIIQLDKNFNEVKRYKNQRGNRKSISDNRVRVIKEDKKGNLWLGTNNGLNIFNPNSEEVKRIEGTDKQTYPSLVFDKLKKYLNSSATLALIDKVGNYQTLSKPIEIDEEGSFIVVAVAEGDPSSMAETAWIENEIGDKLWQMEDFSETFHIGGAAKNRVKMSIITLQPGKYTINYKSDDSHSYDDWNEPGPDYLDLYGIALIKPIDVKEIENLETIVEDDEMSIFLNGSNILAIEFSDQTAWIATNGGLNKIDLSTNETVSYKFDPDNENSISSNLILDILIDPKGLIWLATNEGLNKIDPKTNKVTRYTEQDGLSTNLTETLEMGENGELWIGTQSGLIRMVTNENLDKVTFIKYNATDGLGGDNFISKGSTVDKNGKFYFGGEHGLSMFNAVSTNNLPPSIVISDFSILNKSVLEMGEDSPLDVSLELSDNIDLSHNQNSIGFEFAALHYANPTKNQYAHMLKGYDEEWIYDNRNYASYTNLAPGNYTFVVRASNASGIWNEEGKSMTIKIGKPWWGTWWAYAIYAMLLGGLIYAFNRNMQRRIKMRERERSREKELQQAKEIEKAYTELKNTQAQLIQSEKMASLGELTAGIAHEIQNPLNFVNNFSEVSDEILEELNEELEKGDLDEVRLLAKDLKGNLEKIGHHGKRASNIVRGMLDHSRTNSGEKVTTNLNAIAEEYLKLSYHGLRAKDKSFNASFDLDLDPNLPKIKTVSQDIGRVILNLINNAFQAVSERSDDNEGGYKPFVKVATKFLSSSGGSKELVEITVSDNGKGIPNSIKEKIFQPFFTTKAAGKGTGLGLSLSYDIIKSHNGEIKVESKEGAGTNFIITLPTN